MVGAERDVYNEIVDAGRALTYAVPFDSTEAFNELLPEGLNVAPSMARTFLPNVDLDTPSESLGHRVVGSR